MIEQLRRWCVGWAVLALVVLTTAGCGGGGDDEFELMSFDDFADEEAVAEVVDDGIRLSEKESWLVEVTHVYSQLILLETLEDMIHDMITVQEYERAQDVDLDWVIEVHEITKDAEDFFLRASRYGLPVSLEEEYDAALLVFFEAVQISGFGSDRLLAASLTVGPSGRSLQVMHQPEVETFERLTRESEYYLKSSLRMVERQIEDFRGRVGGIRR